MTALVIRGGHLVDPAAGVDGPKDILLKDGRVAEIAAPGKLKQANGAEVARRHRADGCAGPDRYSRASARARPGLQRDDRHGHGGCCSRRLYGGGGDAQYRSGQRLARDHPMDAVPGARRGGARVSDRGGDAGVEGRRASTILPLSSPPGRLRSPTTASPS